MRRAGFGLALVLAATWAVAPGAVAQDDAEITLPVPETAPETAPETGGTAAEPAAGPAPAAPAPAAVPAVPEIRLDATETAGDAAAAGAPLAVPPPRDQSAPAATAVADWLMPLAPVGDLPDTVRVGASLPAPGVLRLTGEGAALPMRLFLPAGAAPPGELVLAMRSSVNILPEMSALTVTVNGGDPVTVPLQNLAGFAAVRVPVAGLVAGENALDLAVRQPHRIFCGPEASFAVWTEIDLAQSGAPVPPASLEVSADGFVAAVRAQAMRGGRIDVLADAAAAPHALRAVSAALADTMGGAARVAVRSFYAPPGAAIAAVAVIESDRAQVSFRRGASGAIVMQVEYSGDLLPDLAGVLSSTAAATVPEVPLLTPGGPVSFASLGTGGFIGNTHYFRADVPFRLASDWMLLANQKAMLTLHYGFAEGLPQGAILLVKVNDETVRLLPLDRDGGRLQAPLDIGFPTNVLHPGPNAVTLEMMVPGDPPDAACLQRRADMLVVLGDSTLDIPVSPRMRQAGAAVPLNDLTRDSVVVPDGAPGQAQAESAALTLAAAIPPLPDATGAARLNVVMVTAAGLAPLSGLDVGVAQVQDALFPRAALVATEAAAAAPASAPAAPAFRLTEEVPQDAPAADTGPGPMQRFWTGLTQSFAADGWIARELAALRNAAFLGTDGTLAEWLADRRGQALLLQAGDGDELWLVLAPDAGVDAVARALVTLRASGRATGEAALLDADGQWQVWSSGRMPELLEPLSLSNARAVLGNYASWSPLVFSAVLLGLALVSVLPALMLVLLTRRRRGGIG
ncbi:MAG: cellulose biosynthesis cyclic di-GMP-binding regulatory protein BcsB [Paracoccaceae bacterium]|nr:MAG: cellulose biosynthesis cyclic di-GMP-binding regulatory protein BcsB [Paracoccaceae bacterium]